MKKLLILFAAFISLVNGAHALDRKEVIENSLVKTTYDLMQVKHAGACKALTGDSVKFFCTGGVPPVQQLTMIKSGCGIGVTIECPTESAVVFGHSTTVYALDEKGYRDDVEPVYLGLNFNKVTITAK